MEKFSKISIQIADEMKMIPKVINSTPTKIFLTHTISSLHINKFPSSSFPSDLTTDDMFSNGTNQKYRAHSISSSSSTSYQNYNPSSTGGASTSASSGINHHQDAVHLNAITQGRRVQNSLQRHERQQDEMFEL